MMRVAMLGSLPPLRALSAYCVELAEAMAARYPVHFLSFRAIYPAFLYPGGAVDDHSDAWVPRQAGLRISARLAWYNPFSWFAAGLTRADLIHAQWWSLPLLPVYWVVLGLFRLRGKPVVITVHNVASHERSRLYSRLSGVLYRLGDHFIVHSRRNREQLIRTYRLPPPRVSVIPHGPLQRFAAIDATPAQARRRLGLPEEGPLVLLFGAIRPYKGIDTALQAMALLNKRLPAARLLVAGKPWVEWRPYGDYIRGHGLEAQVMLHLDYIPAAEVGYYFRAADLVILPYRRFDSQSGIGAVAVAFARPLVVSDCGGLPDLVGDRRWVVPPGEPAPLAEALYGALSDPAALARMAAEARAVREAMSWSRIARQTARIYETLSEAQGE